MNKYLVTTFIVCIVLIALNAKTQAEVTPCFIIDPHDSLLFDGSGSIQMNTDVTGQGCYIKAFRKTGKVNGKVLKRELAIDCSEIPDTITISVDKEIEAGDNLVEGTDIKTGPDSRVDVMIMVSGQKGSNGAMVLTVGPNSVLTLPMVSSLCTALKTGQPKKEQISIKSGKVKVKTKASLPAFNLSNLDLLNLRDDPEETRFEYLFKNTVETKGKNSTVIHTKTEYSHEVKVDGADTLDIIRVYEGSVEVSMVSIDRDDENITKKMEKLSEDIQAGKLTAEEVQAKMQEFQDYGQKINELMTPLAVEEGSKCTVTKNSRVVEPLGSGDEDDAK